MTNKCSSLGEYYFYDCGAYGLFTLVSERFQPMNHGDRTGQFDKFFGREREKIVPEDTLVWNEVGAVLEAIGPKVSVLDVGGYIGTFSIPLALSAREKGLDLNITSYEPGPTQEVLRINIDTNGLSDVIDISYSAMSNCDGYAIYKFSQGGSIGGSMILGPSTGAIHRIVPTQTIDAATKGLKGNLFIKLDTQGHEAQIMKHAKEEIARARAVWLIEYLPWSASTDVGGETFQDMLLKNFHVFSEGQPITAENFDEFNKRTDASKYRMADLILIPKAAKFADKAVAAVTA